MAGRKKKGPCCVALNCSKRKKIKEDDREVLRSDSDGSEDEESQVKRALPRTFHTSVHILKCNKVFYIG